MKIADSAIHLSSQHSAVEHSRVHQSLTVWQNGRQPRTEHAEGQQQIRELNAKMHLQDRVSINRQGMVHRRNMEVQEAEIPEDQQAEADLNMRLLRALFEKITGRKFQMIQPFASSGHGGEASAATSEIQAESAPQELPEGFGLAYDYHEVRYESEKTSFGAEGIIQTSDGQQLEINLTLSMSREYYEENTVRLRAGEALKDPLVINYSGTAAQVTERNFSFDIDADGHKDQIAFVQPGSGFLAFDKNNDKIINDGSELFGAMTGDGFGELKAYDLDNNNWIDENDDIYESLRIWSKNSAGEERLLGLGQQGVGAIYLGHVETLFSIKDDENSLLGQVRETSVALMESGEAVTVQQLDLVA